MFCRLQCHAQRAYHRRMQPKSWRPRCLWITCAERIISRCTSSSQDTTGTWSAGANCTRRRSSPSTKSLEKVTSALCCSVAEWPSAFWLALGLQRFTFCVRSARQVIVFAFVLRLRVSDVHDKPTSTEKVEENVHPVQQVFPLPKVPEAWNQVSAQRLERVHFQVSTTHRPKSLRLSALGGAAVFCSGANIFSQKNNVEWPQHQSPTQNLPTKCHSILG